MQACKIAVSVTSRVRTSCGLLEAQRCPNTPMSVPGIGIVCEG
jgi:hypothetical protein